MITENSFVEEHKKDSNGIFVPVQLVDIPTKFSEELENFYFSLEDTSWWYKYRAGVIENLAGVFFNKDCCVTDVGGGAVIRHPLCKKAIGRFHSLNRNIKLA